MVDTWQNAAARYDPGRVPRLGDTLGWKEYLDELEERGVPGELRAALAQQRRQASYPPEYTNPPVKFSDDPGNIPGYYGQPTGSQYADARADWERRKEIKRIKGRRGGGGGNGDGGGDWDWNWEDILEEMPETAFHTALPQTGSPNMRSYFEGQFDTIYNQYLGGLGRQVTEAQSLEDLTPWTQYLKDTDWSARFHAEPASARGFFPSRFAPQARFAF